ncbi:hypothetical protein TRVL_02558 [Trypanosoma vivax]|uniref:Uncharacterized protein n=1 Tax=Trypanosoma vivax (strain Y486) TaxID=1055687 RepID=G0UB09_TRYVY|nr:hypothetical protein TRVL_02558 [Trypanosoma vivax]CCC52996.1 conserved hypothetical protein [Trypanosoma vivax Y486]
MSGQVALSAVCLGTGTESTMVYEGKCSAAYVLCANGRPVVLFGAGYGVVRQCLRYFGVVPPTIAVFSSSPHTSAELPVIIATENRKGTRLHIVAGEKVMSRLKRHQLDFLCCKGLCDASSSREGCLHRFVALPASTPAPAACSSQHQVADATAVSFAAFEIEATEACNAFVVYHHGVPVLAMTGDCAYDIDRHQRILQMAPVVILDGQQVGSQEHSSFANIGEAVDRYIEAGKTPPRVFIGHYGKTANAPLPARDGIVSLITEGEVVTLGRTFGVTCVSEFTHASKYGSQSGSEQNRTRDQKDIFLIDNDTPETLPVQLFVHPSWSMAQVKKQVSELLGVQLVGGLFCAKTGRRLKEVSQLSSGMRVVVTRVGGGLFQHHTSSPIRGGQQNTPVAPPIENLCVRQTDEREGDLSETEVSAALKEYLQRAYRFLQRPGPDMAPSDRSVVTCEQGTDEVADVACFATRTTPSMALAAECAKKGSLKEPNDNARACTLRFTTLGT